jgi:hypothetical protein
MFLVSNNYFSFQDTALSLPKIQKILSNDASRCLHLQIYSFHWINWQKFYWLNHKTLILV